MLREDIDYEEFCRSIERPHELTAMFLDPLVFSEIADCATGLYYPEITPTFAIHDPLIRS